MSERPARMSACSRSSFSRRAALAVNWTLYRPAESGSTPPGPVPARGAGAAERVQPYGPVSPTADDSTSSGRGVTPASVTEAGIAPWPWASDPVPASGAVLGGQVRRDHRDSAQVDAAVLEHREQLRVPPRCACHRDAQASLRLGEVEHFGAVREERRYGRARIEAPLVDLGEMGDESGLAAAHVTDERRQAEEELVVRQRVQRVLGAHAHNIGRDLPMPQGWLLGCSGRPRCLEDHGRSPRPQ
jgi:hypothetical protein